MQYPQHESVGFIHIRKSGGTAVKKMLRTDSRFVLHKHNMTLEKLWHNDPHRRVFFIVRDPIERFVSGFNSRLRQGAPAHKWQRAASNLAMHSINHVRHPLKTWLHNPDFLERHKERIIFIGLLSRLEDELAIMREWLGLSEEYRLPEDAVEAHRAPPESSKHLSEAGERNIANWYASDYPLYTWCLQFRENMGLRNG